MNDKGLLSSHSQHFGEELSVSEKRINLLCTDAGYMCHGGAHRGGGEKTLCQHLQLRGSKTVRLAHRCMFFFSSVNELY